MKLKIFRVLKKIRSKIILTMNKYRFKLWTKILASQEMTCDFHGLILYQPLIVDYFHGGKYAIGHNVQFGYDIGGKYKGGFCELQCRDKNASIKIGDYTAINNNFMAICRNRITIGEHCRIGINCKIMDFEAHSIKPLVRHVPGIVGIVEIGNNVWIGNNVTILKNVTIGENSIVGAGSVVCHNVPPNAIVAGVPAKLIRMIDENE